MTQLVDVADAEQEELEPSAAIAVALYPISGRPPASTAAHETAIAVFAATPTTELGLLGKRAGITAALSAVATEDPTAFTAVTEN
jgi:hypothetical protein